MGSITISPTTNNGGFMDPIALFIIIFGAAFIAWMKWR